MHESILLIHSGTYDSHTCHTYIHIRSHFGLYLEGGTPRLLLCEILGAVIYNYRRDTWRGVDTSQVTVNTAMSCLVLRRTALSARMSDNGQ